jgi:exopolysaccharide biosynthesis polyprenyl glycosylphosphotransferase
MNHRHQKCAEVEWARLIPGQAPPFRRSARKPPQSVRPFALESSSAPAPEAERRPLSDCLELIAPAPLQGRMGLKWLRSLATDFAFVGLSWALAEAVVHGLVRVMPDANLLSLRSGVSISVPGLPILQAALITLMGYSEGLDFEDVDLREKARILGKSILWATSLLCLALWLQGGRWATIALCCATGTLNLAALWGWRWFSERGGKVARTRGESRNVLIVGTGQVGRGVAAYLEQRPATRRNVCGFLDDETPPGDRVLGRIADLARIARREFVDEVILTSARSSEVTRWILEEARRLRLDVEIVPELFGCQPVGRRMEQVGGVSVICLHAERLPAAGLVLKRFVDVAGGALALALLAPLLVAISILIKLDSDGPVLYCAKRAGRKGRLFRCYKFRTMVSNADELKEQLRRNNERAGPFFKMVEDPRITKLGRYLRRYSLDELPQLWNVVKGEMSLVGPRPHPLDDVAEYEIQHLGRLDVTPGITGLWQVTARRDPSFRRGIELDREYIRSWSLGLDLRILLRTFRAVVCGSGD